MEAVTGTQAKAADRYAIDVLGIPSLELMENASREIKDYLLEGYKDSSILIVSGTGNNGADGICIANLIIKDQSFTQSPRILITGSIERASWEFLYQLSELKRLGGSFEFIKDDPLPKADVLIDAVFGIGLKGNLREDKAKLLSMLDNNKYPHVVAVDVPSGINSDSGELTGAGIHADTTITFGRMKTGLLTKEGKEYAGNVLVKDIGIPGECYSLVRS